MVKKIPIAIAYDFDGTLSPGNMQEHSFIPDLGISKNKFWNEAKENAKKHNMDEILAYMHLMLEKARNAGKRINRQAFQEHGKKIEFFDGIPDWFDRINKYAIEKEVNIKHFIISSGLRELIDGSDIKNKFEYIFASGFMYDQHDVAIWPALALNYTTKTQFLFRINKGIMNSYDNSRINKFTPQNERPFPFSKMIYIGDGETDIPCMKMIRHQGGYAIAVYNPRTRRSRKKVSLKENAIELLSQERTDYVAKADYSAGEELEQIVKAIIDKIVAESKLYRVKRQYNKR